MPAKAFVFNTPNENVFSHPFGSLFDTRSGMDLENDGIPFNQGLYTGYVALSDERGDAWWGINAWDFVDAELFNHKARTAARNSIVLPEHPLDRELSDEDRIIFRDALERLRAAFDRGGRSEAAADAAKAQVSYDCWIEATEDGRADDAAACKAAFEDAMKEVEFWATYKLTEIGYIAEEPPLQPQSYLVYFDFDKSNLTSEGASTMADVIRDALAAPNTTVRLVAHTDTSGSLNYNQALSERRANTVISGLIDGGVSAERIVSDPVGETQPLVDTGDGVREQGNRVVEIDFM